MSISTMIIPVRYILSLSLSHIQCDRLRFKYLQTSKENKINPSNSELRYNVYNRLVWMSVAIKNCSSISFFFCCCYSVSFRSVLLCSILFLIHFNQFIVISISSSVPFLFFWFVLLCDCTKSVSFIQNRNFNNQPIDEWLIAHLIKWISSFDFCFFHWFFRIFLKETQSRKIYFEINSKKLLFVR